MNLAVSKDERFSKFLFPMMSSVAFCTLLLVSGAAAFPGAAPPPPTSLERLKEAASAAAVRAHSATVHAAQSASDFKNEVSPGVAAQVGDGWNKLVGASNSLTSEAASAFEKGMGGTMNILKRMLGVTEEMLKQILMACANIAFCMIMLYGFQKLPADFMLLVGLVTFFIGPSLVLFVCQILGALGFLAAWAPMGFVAVLFFLALFKSAAAQFLFVRMGLDKNGDGNVDWRDVVHAARHARWYAKFKAWIQGLPASLGRFVRLQDVEEALTKDEASLDALQQQMRAMELKIDRLCEKLGANGMDV